MEPSNNEHPQLCREVNCPLLEGVTTTVVERFVLFWRLLCIECIYKGTLRLKGLSSFGMSFGQGSTVLLITKWWNRLILHRVVAF